MVYALGLLLILTVLVDLSLNGLASKNRVFAGDAITSPAGTSISFPPRYRDK